MHRRGILKKYKPRLHIGSLEGKTAPAAAPTPAPAPAAEKVKPAPPAPAPPAPASPAPKPEGSEREPLEMGGDLIPFGDPSWYQGVGLPFPSLWLLGR